MSSIFEPRVPAGAFDHVLVDALPAAREQPSWTDADGALPSMYLSHGAPPLLDDGPWMRDLGRRIRELRQEGTLVIGSGFMTHGLPFLTRESIASGQVPSWSRDFDAWAAELLAAGDVEGLARYAAEAPGLPYAHPTVEHLSPLFVTLGAADQPEQPVTTTVDGWMMGLSRRSFQLS